MKKINSTHLTSLLLAASTFLLAGALAAQGQTSTWTGLGNDSTSTTGWADNNNWSPVGSPAGNALVFPAGITDIGLTSGDDIAGVLSITGLTFSSGAGAYVLGVTPGNSVTTSGALVDNSTNAEAIGFPIALSASQTIYVTNGGSLTFNGVISGAGFSLTNNGAGTNTFAATNTFNGNLNINSGTVIGMTSSFALGTTNRVILGTNGGTTAVTLLGDGRTFTNSLTVVSNNGSITIGNVYAANTTFSGAMTLNGPLTVIESGNNSYDTTAGAFFLGGAITGTNQITIISSPAGVLMGPAIALVDYGAVNLGVNSPSFTGSYYITTNSSLRVAGHTSASNTIYVDVGGQLNCVNANPTIAGLRDGTSGGGFVGFDSEAGSSRTLILGGSGNYSFSGILRNAVGASAHLSLTVALTGSGVQKLSGASTYSNPTILQSGILNLGGPETPGTSGPIGEPSTVVGGLSFTGGTLQYSVSNQFDYSGRFSTNAGQQYNIDLAGQTVSFGTALASSTGTLTLADSVGGGSLTLNGINTFAGATTIKSGVLVIGSTGQLGAGNYAGAITNNGTLTNNSSAAQTFSGGLFGTGTLLQAGPGTLGLTPVGNIGTVTVNDGTALDVAVSGASQLSVTNFTLGNSIGATNEFITVSSTTTAPVKATTLTLNGANTVNILASSLAVGNYPLISFGNLTGGGSIAIGTLPSGASGNIITNGNTISLHITSSAPTVWSGAVNSNWDIGTTANWTFNGASAFYGDGATVQFGDTAVSQFSLNLAANVAPSSMTFSNSVHNYTIGSTGGFSIGGAGGLTLTGNGSLTLNTINTFTGPTTISAGQLVIGGAGQLGTGTYSSAIIDNGLLNYSSSAAQTLSGAVSGTGALIQNGPGTLTLSGPDTYTGGTTVTAGLLSLTTSNTTSQVTVNDSGILDITVSGASQLSPASLTLGSSSGATGEFIAVSSTTNAPVKVTTLTLNGANTINIVTGTFTAGLNYPLIQYSTLSGAGSYVLGTVLGGAVTSGTLFTSNNIIYFTIPPATFVLTGSDAVGASSFNVAGFWSPNLAPSAGNIYQTANFLLRTPQNTTPITFAGASLEVQSGGTFRDKTLATVTVANLIVDDGATLGSTQPNGVNGVGAVATLAGAITLSGGTANLDAGNAFGDLAGEVFIINAPMSGPGGWTTAGSGTAIFGTANSFSGGLLIVTPDTAVPNYVQLANANAVSNSVVTINALNGLTFSSGIGTFNLGGLAGTAPESLTDTNGGAVTLVVGENSTNTIYSGQLSGSGGLTKVTTNTLILSGTNTYTGATTVNAGILGVITANTGAGAMVVNDGGTLDVTVSGTNQLSPASYTLGSSAGATNEFLSVVSTNLAPVNLTTLTLNGTNTINVISGYFVVGASYPLISYNSLAGSGKVVLGSLPPGVGAYLTTNGNTVTLNVTSITPIIWTGAVNNSWDVNTTSNWTFNGFGSVYLDNSYVQFNDGGANPDVNIATTVSPTSVTVNNNSTAYSFSGYDIGGGAILIKNGSGTVTLNNNNTYTGNTVINNGTLMLSGGGALPNTAIISIAPNATFDVSSISFNLLTNQILTGGGAVNGPMLADGTISPVGTLTITNGLTFDGNLTFAINTSLAQSNDVLVAYGGLNNTGTGTLKVSNVGPPLLAGQTFYLFNTALGGNNLTIVPPPGVVFTNNLAVDGSLTVLSVPAVSQPHITSVSLSGANLVISGSNGVAGESYNVLTTTNLALPLTNWTVLPTNTFTGGSFNITNPVNATTPRSFYILRVP